MLAGEVRVRNPKKTGIYLSAVSSFVFNEVLAQRIQQELWGRSLPGDVMDEVGRPTRPPWGRGRWLTTDQAQALEDGVAERHAALRDGMEHTGLDQQRRRQLPQCPRTAHGHRLGARSSRNRFRAPRTAAKGRPTRSADLVM